MPESDDRTSAMPRHPGCPLYRPTDLFEDPILAKYVEAPNCVPGGGPFNMRTEQKRPPPTRGPRGSGPTTGCGWGSAGNSPRVNWSSAPILAQSCHRGAWGQLVDIGPACQVNWRALGSTGSRRSSGSLSPFPAVLSSPAWMGSIGRPRPPPVHFTLLWPPPGLFSFFDPVGALFNTHRGQLVDAPRPRTRRQPLGSRPPSPWCFLFSPLHCAPPGSPPGTAHDGGCLFQDRAAGGLTLRSS